MGWTVSKTIGCETFDEVSNAFKIKSVVQLSNGNTPALVTNHS